MSSESPRPPIARFISRLERLDASGRARLKRSVGRPPGEAREALGLFYSLLPPGVPEPQEADYFLLATLYPLADGAGQGDLGAALRRARGSANAKGLDRRITSLLDADREQLPFRLRQAVQYLRSRRVRVNWPALLQDILLWTHPERTVQRRWARSYFAEDLRSKE